MGKAYEGNKDFYTKFWSCRGYGNNISDNSFAWIDNRNRKELVLRQFSQMSCKPVEPKNVTFKTLKYVDTDEVGQKVLSCLPRASRISESLKKP